MARLKHTSSSELALAILKNHLNTDTTLEERVTELERRLNIQSRALDRDHVHARDDVGVFFTHADESEVMADQYDKDRAYRHWLRHYKENPAQLEPGRSAHEMAALKASTS